MGMWLMMMTGSCVSGSNRPASIATWMASSRVSALSCQTMYAFSFSSSCARAYSMASSLL
jgi:hypothetical protein